MPEEKNKITTGIYLLDTDICEVMDFDYVVEFIMSDPGNEKFNFKKERLSTDTIGGHRITLYSCQVTRPPKWAGFLKRIISNDSTLANCRNTNYSFICFIHFDDQIFAVCGGLGNFAIQNYIIQDFGMEILVRLVKKNDRVVKSIQDRGVTGTVLGQTKFFRGDQRLSDENEFGKIYKQVQAELGTSILTRILGFNEKELKRKVSGCLAKSSFQLNKSIDFETMLKLIEKLSVVLRKEPNFTLNKVTLIRKKGDGNIQLIKELDEHTLQTLYHGFVNGQTADFDFCHRDFESFLTAASYQLVPDTETNIPLEHPVTLTAVIKELNHAGYDEPKDPIEFKVYVLERSLETSDEDGKLLTQGTVMEHLHGEIIYKGITYFLIDGMWYKIKQDFINDLNDGCRELLKQAWLEGFIAQRFDIRKRESIFNEQFVGEPNWFVFDTILPENIEACDILRYDDNNVHVIHVKKGFNNSLRDLAAQVLIAAKRIQLDMKSGYDFIDELESMTKKTVFSESSTKKKLGSQTFPPGGLKTVFNNKLDNSIVFCLAFVDEATEERSLKTNPALFNSNIAKYSILELSKQIRGMGFDFKIIQLLKSV